MKFVETKKKALRRGSLRLTGGDDNSKSSVKKLNKVIEWANGWAWGGR